jgi:hypothetical protein
VQDDAASFLEMATFYFMDGKSPLVKDNPEFVIYRDVVALYKLMLAEPSHRRSPKLRRWQIHQATLHWSLKELNKAKTMADLNVGVFGIPDVCIDNPKVPYSPADIRSYLPEVKFPTEDDCLHSKQLPNFSDMLSQEVRTLTMGSSHRHSPPCAPPRLALPSVGLTLCFRLCCGCVTAVCCVLTGL